MRKPLMAVVLLALTLFGVGYVVGQVSGVASSAAASNGPTQFVRSTFQPFAAGTTAKHADGKVTAINGDTITVQADNDASNQNEYTSVTTVQLTSSTQYNVGGGKSAIKVGSYIVAQGTVSADGKTLTATQVSLGGPGGAGCPHGTSSSTTPGTGTSTGNA